ncbi:MAG: DUF2508 family protein [Oscillospiraceae bacterium]|nr:DUF2508 family protein [Oscillospiraceae bacterium]MBQ4544129.1 DUF2508 family protein [Oscillospiraceae bacterium]MBQ6902120.1 DUF2508 family protein [Oscillospiraceae bacterium]
MDKSIRKESILFDKLRTRISPIFQKKKEDTVSAEKKQLLSEIEAALSDLRYARSCFADARDPEIIEACIFEIKSAEARYSYLLRKAKLMAAYDKKMSVS